MQGKPEEKNIKESQDSSKVEAITFSMPVQTSTIQLEQLIIINCTITTFLLGKPLYFCNAFLQSGASLGTD